MWEGQSGQFRTANGRNWPGTNFEFVVVQNFGPLVQIQNFRAVQNLIFFSNFFLAKKNRTAAKDSEL